MEEKGPEITFMFQFGLIRDAVTVSQSTLNLKTIKLLAVDFLNSKVRKNIKFQFGNETSTDFSLQIPYLYSLDTRSWSQQS